jgi:hypothetical protein
LAEHTSTPDSCWFCLWDGHGWTRETGISSVWNSELAARSPLSREHSIAPRTQRLCHQC